MAQWAPSVSGAPPQTSQDDDVLRETMGFRESPTQRALFRESLTQRTLFTGPEAPSARAGQPGKSSESHRNHTRKPGPSPFSAFGPGPFGNVGAATSGESTAAFDSVIQFWKATESRASLEDFNKLKVELDTARQQAQASESPSADS